VLSAVAEDNIADGERVCRILNAHFTALDGIPRANCGSAAARDQIAGTLDDVSWLRLTLHFWMRSKQPWVTLPEGDQNYETQPGSYRRSLPGIGNFEI
jgi:hypothetical protein